MDNHEVKQDLDKLGYSQEEMYFNQLNRELLEKMHKARKKKQIKEQQDKRQDFSNEEDKEGFLTTLQKSLSSYLD